jgi:hypothetical protein
MAVLALSRAMKELKRLVRSGLKSKRDMKSLLRNPTSLSKQAIVVGCPTSLRVPLARCPETTTYSGFWLH